LARFAEGYRIMKGVAVERISIVMLLLLTAFSAFPSVLAAGDLSTSSFSVTSIGQDSLTVTLKWTVHLTTSDTPRPAVYFVVPGDNYLRFITPDDPGWKNVEIRNEESWWEVDFPVTSH
jgi:hypothetical protein